MDQTSAHPIHPALPDRPTRLTLGQLGESIAAEYLEELGYRILARNWRDGRQGELDIIATKDDCVAAVEVKTRSGTGFGHPLEAITARKAARLRRLLLAWAEETHPNALNLRVDAIGITLSSGKRAAIDHIEGIR